MSLALSMIVKNGADSLRYCLESARNVVDEVVIADTGSTDESCAIATEFGAKLIHIPWEDDFARARNHALGPVTADWVLILDADEELDPDAATALPPLLAVPDAGGAIGGYLVTIRNYLPWRYGQILTGVSKPNDGRMERGRSAPSYAEHQGCRLFRRHPVIEYEGRLHESTDERVRQAGYKLGSATFLIHHFGQLLPSAVTKQKHVWYRELARQKVEERPQDARAQMELGLEYEGMWQFEQAAACFRRAAELAPRWVAAWMFLCRVSLYLGRYREVLAMADNVRGTADANQLREEYRGDALHNLGELKLARLAYLKALKMTGPHALLEGKLGYVELRLGMLRMGMRKLRKALDDAPEIAENYDRLMKGLILTGDLAGAAEVVERKILRFPSREACLRLAGIRKQLGQETEASQLFRAADRLCSVGADRRGEGGVAGGYAATENASTENAATEICGEPSPIHNNTVCLRDEVAP